MKKAFVGLAIPAVTGLAILAAMLLFVIGMGGMTATLSGGQTDTSEAQNTSSRCVPGAGPAHIPEEYRDAVAWAAQESGLSQELIAAQIDNESGWDPNASSGVALGISQFTPKTFAQYGEGDIWDPQESIKAQGRYMKTLMDMYEDQAKDKEEQVILALAAYNAGPGNVQTYGGVPPFPETQNYVKNIPAAAQGKFVEDCAQPDTGREIGDVGTGDWTHPLPGGDYNSGFGPRPCPPGTECNKYTANHGGMDFSTGGGTAVIAPTDIEITATGSNQYQGEFVIGRMLESPKYVLQFHHCQTGSTSVAIGDTVAVGTELCIEGNTGNTSGGANAGYHLHFQINTKEADDTRPTYDYAVDPAPILLEAGVDF